MSISKEKLILAICLEYVAEKIAFFRVCDQISIHVNLQFYKSFNPNNYFEYKS